MKRIIYLGLIVSLTCGGSAFAGTIKSKGNGDYEWRSETEITQYTLVAKNDFLEIWDYKDGNILNAINGNVPVFGIKRNDEVYADEVTEEVVVGVLTSPFMLIGKTVSVFTGESEYKKKKDKELEARRQLIEEERHRYSYGEQDFKWAYSANVGDVFGHSFGSQNEKVLKEAEREKSGELEAWARLWGGTPEYKYKELDNGCLELINNFEKPNEDKSHKCIFTSMGRLLSVTYRSTDSFYPVMMLPEDPKNRRNKHMVRSNDAKIRALMKDILGQELYLEKGSVLVDNGKKRITFDTDIERIEKFYRGMKDDVNFITTFTIEDLEALNMIDKDNQDKIARDNRIKEEALRKKKETEDAIAKELESRPVIDSFCGINLGAILNDGMLTADGKYYTAKVNLSKPVGGVRVAEVWATIKSRRVFCVRITNSNVDDKVIMKKYNIGHDYIGTGDKVKESDVIYALGYDAERKRTFHLKNGRIEMGREKVKGDAYQVSHTEKGYNFSDVPRRLDAGTGNWENTTTETRYEEKTNYWMEVISDEYEKLANKEYEEESGGDGSNYL